MYNWKHPNRMKYTLKSMRKNQTDPNTKPKVTYADDKKYTVEQVAREHLHKSTKTVYKWIKERKLKAYRIGNEFIITASQLNEFAESIKLKHSIFSQWDLSEIDPAYVPPLEVDIDSLSEAEVLGAKVFVSEFIELFDKS
jgi:excisionase family DNA binding protein